MPGGWLGVGGGWLGLGVAGWGWWVSDSDSIKYPITTLVGPP